MSAAEIPHDDVASATPRSRFLPQTAAQATLGIVVLMFLAGTVGMLIGVRLGGDAPAAGSVDVGFLFDMSAHHQQAVILAEIELTNGQDPTMQGFAREIMRAQSYEIGLMAMRLGTWDHDPAERPDEAMAWMGMATAPDAMPGTATAAQLRALQAAHGPEADALFVALMTAHHEGGVEMAEYAATHAKDTWVRDTAARMAAIQRQEILEMGRARVRAGLPDRSSGTGSTTTMPGMPGHTA